MVQSGSKYFIKRLSKHQVECLKMAGPYAGEGGYQCREVAHIFVILPRIFVTLKIIFKFNYRLTMHVLLPTVLSYSLSLLIFPFSDKRQMNEPPGARARVALTGLTVAEYFRDQEGQDVLLFNDNTFRFTQVRKWRHNLSKNNCILPGWCLSICPSRPYPLCFGLPANPCHQHG